MLDGLTKWLGVERVTAAILMTSDGVAWKVTVFVYLFGWFPNVLVNN